MHFHCKQKHIYFEHHEYSLAHVSQHTPVDFCDVKKLNQIILFIFSTHVPDHFEGINIITELNSEP